GMSEAALISAARTDPRASSTSTVTASRGRIASRTMARASAIVTGCDAILVVSLWPRKPCDRFPEGARRRREADLRKLSGGLNHRADDLFAARGTRGGALAARGPGAGERRSGGFIGGRLSVARCRCPSLRAAAVGAAV